MRIEKISEKQIRCTLNQKDLKDREIGISELAYGTAKAKALFQDMMQQASYEFGFQADDIPLMIEAIPLLPEALILIITKVDEPDELDTRFSTFVDEDSNSDEDAFLYNDDDDSDIYDNDAMEYFEEQSDTMLEDGFSWMETTPEDAADNLDTAKIKDTAGEKDDFISLPEMLGLEPRKKQQEPKQDYDIAAVFSFRDLDTVIQFASSTHMIYNGTNSLFKDTKTGIFYLILHRSSHSSSEFGRICNIAQEYGASAKHSMYSQYYFEEHLSPVLKGCALQTLAGI